MAVDRPVRPFEGYTVWAEVPNSVVASRVHHMEVAGVLAVVVVENPKDPARTAAVDRRRCLDTDDVEVVAAVVVAVVEVEDGKIGVGN